MLQPNELNNNEISIIKTLAKQVAYSGNIPYLSSLQGIDMEIMLAMLHTQLSKDGRTIEIYDRQHNYYDNTQWAQLIQNLESSPNRIVEPFRYEPNSNSGLMVMFIDTKRGKQVYDYIKEVIRVNKEYENKQNVSIALTQHSQHKVQAVLRNNRTLMILSNEINRKLIEQTLAIIPLVFGFKDSLSKLEKDILLAISTGKEHTQIYKEYLKSKADVILNIKAKQMMTLLNSSKENKIKDLSKERDDLRRYINDYYKNIQEYQNKLDGVIERLAGIELLSKDADDVKTKEVIEFLQNSKMIKDYYISSNERRLYLSIEIPIRHYDPELLERMVESESWADGNTGKLMHLKIMSKIFIERKYSLITRVICYIDLKYKTLSKYDSGSGAEITSNMDILKQPHIMEFNCWGNNESLIKRALQNEDLIQALNQILASCSNLNFTDSAVFRRTYERLSQDYSYKPTILNNETGEMISYRKLAEIILNEIEGGITNNENN